MSSQLHALCQIPRLYLAWNAVKGKGAAGGIDRITILDFEKEKRGQIQKLAEELKAGTWKPQPYLEIEVAKTKSPDEMRKLGMISVRDKIVQQAIKSLIEPRYERIFLGNSYGYRPGKGATKAIKRVLAECRKSQYSFVLRLDIDNFFDSIDHNILQKRLIATGTDVEIVRLIMLCVKMGKVKRDSREWVETEFGTPQGAVLSPILSNLYLHSFDQFAVSRNVPYIRYADDFLFLTETKRQAEEILEKTETHLMEKLKLSLNQPTTIVELNTGFDFLGITIKDRKATITEKKREDLSDRICELELNVDGLSLKSDRVWKGIYNYYGKLLPQEDLEYFDSVLHKRLITFVHERFDIFESKRKLLFALGTLYVRVWQSLLAARLNPFDSLIHVHREGKPTLVYDMVEIFRSQVVDRVVISLVQKGHDLEVHNGLLTDKTRQLLVKSIMERLARYEKYQGEEMKMEQILFRQAKLLAKAFEGNEKFKPYVAKW